MSKYSANVHGTCHIAQMWVGPTKNIFGSKTGKMVFVSHHLAYLTKPFIFFKKLSMSQNTNMFVGCHFIQIIYKKTRNNSKLESVWSPKANYGSCYRRVASLMRMSKKNDMNHSVLLDLDFRERGGDQEIHLSAWWQLFEGQRQESSRCFVKSTWCREYAERWRWPQTMWKQMLSVSSCLNFQCHDPQG